MEYKYFIIYLALISLISVMVCIADKSRAKRGKWRVKESTLFLLCFLGGSVAMYITMRAIHHKTLHKRFMVGVPIIIILQTAVIVYLYFKIPYLT
ncbi:MAG: DUF1294 domain-containing protein [Acutalibacteraceae bacterium]|nr:DUF1294 domain-containing protein [Acutalibacteraceae bacterium]